MGKKYIIEIPEDKIGDFVGSTHFLMPYMMAGHIGHHDTGLPIEPYTEPNLEHVWSGAYEKGYEDGFVAGHLKAEKSGQSFYEDGYKRGLSDAWEACRKICCYEIDGGYPVAHMLDLFDRDDLPKILSDHTATEAITKIKEYEDGKQEYRVGDEFENGAGQKFVVLKMDGKEIDRYIDGDGKTYVMTAKYRVMRKTGRHFPEITAVLEKMRGEKE